MSSSYQTVVVLPDRPSLLSRRQALRVAAVVAAGAAVGWPDEEAEANPFLWFVGRTVFAGALGWLVTRLLERAFPDDPEVLAVRHVPHPQPSPDAFHNRFAEPFTIGNRDYHLPSTYSNSGGCYLDVGEYIRASRNGQPLTYGDLNTPEMERSRSEFGGLLIPMGKRQCGTQQDAQFAAACAKYGRNPDDVQLDYVREFLVRAAGNASSPIQAQYSPKAKYGGSVRDGSVIAFGITERTSGQRRLLALT